MTKVKKVYSGKRQFFNAATTLNAGIASSNVKKAYNERNYMWVAKKILKAQKKLGAIKSMNVKVESLSESREDRLKQTGVLIGAYLGTAAIMAGAGGLNAKDNNNNFKSGALRSARSALAGSAVAGGFDVLKNQVIDRNKRNVVIHVKYKYGERMFVVFQLKAKYENEGIENIIFKNVKNAINTLKSRGNFPAREDVQ